MSDAYPRFVGALSGVAVYFKRDAQKFFFLGELEEAILRALRTGASDEQIVSELSPDLQAHGQSTLKTLKAELVSSVPSESLRSRRQSAKKVLPLDEPSARDDQFLCSIALGPCTVNLFEQGLDEERVLSVEAFLARVLKTETACEPESSNPWLSIRQSDDGHMTFVSDYVFFADIDQPVNRIGECIESLVFCLGELACNAVSPVAILHAASLVLNEKLVIFCNASGSGKTSLAVYFDQSTEGATLIHDDVLPISADGAIRQLLTPISLKEGVWAQFDRYIGSSAGWHDGIRLARPVRYVANPGHLIPALNLREAIVVFPTFDLNATPNIKPISDHEAVKRILATECVLTDQSPDALGNLIDWLSSCRYFEINYSSSEQGAELVREIFK